MKVDLNHFFAYFDDYYHILQKHLACPLTLQRSCTATQVSSDILEDFYLLRLKASYATVGLIQLAVLHQ